MSTYTPYSTTIPVLRNICNCAINILTTAKEERAAQDTLPTEQELLDTAFADMLPMRLQPILFGKFAVAGIQKLGLHGSTPVPEMNPAAFSSFDDMITFFKQVAAIMDAVDEKAYNESANKDFDMEVASKTLHMSGLEDFAQSFAIPNAYFHLNAIYMLLRSKGFKLGKGKYIGAFFTEQAKNDWKPITG
ncbi:hypothetical protein BDW02DRAFT_567054 [Decorospora gaudefroyi]|uniref:Uncharacterized protein n=1 Tax=Decorospora gaudefroyi TaxID=184978 RepID=A0A6A5KS60_9PLEO|nr:hypothetical protein BDW02DRAFT_567054 [Decorospora gaudefroyi]